MGVLIKTVLGIVGVPAAAVGGFYLIGKRGESDSLHTSSKNIEKQVTERMDGCTPKNDSRITTHSSVSGVGNGIRSLNVTGESSHTVECTSYSISTTG